MTLRLARRHQAFLKAEPGAPKSLPAWRTMGVLRRTATNLSVTERTAGQCVPALRRMAADAARHASWTPDHSVAH